MRMKPKVSSRLFLWVRHLSRAREMDEARLAASVGVGKVGITEFRR